MNKIKTAVTKFNLQSSIQYWYKVSKPVTRNSNCSSFLIPRISEVLQYDTCEPSFRPQFVVCHKKRDFESTTNIVNTTDESSTLQNSPLSLTFVLKISGGVIAGISFIIIAYLCIPNSVKVSVKSCYLKNNIKS